MYKFPLPAVGPFGDRDFFSQQKAGLVIADNASGRKTFSG
jgi:hypothetical protein